MLDASDIPLPLTSLSLYLLSPFLSRLLQAASFLGPGLSTTVPGPPPGGFSMSPSSGGQLCHLRGFSLCLALPFRPGDCHGLCRPWSCRVGHDRLSPSLSNLSHLICLLKAQGHHKADPRLPSHQSSVAHFSPWTGHFHHLTSASSHVFAHKDYDIPSTIIRLGFCYLWYCFLRPEAVTWRLQMINR